MDRYTEYCREEEENIDSFIQRKKEKEMNVENIKITSIKDKTGENLTADEVKEKLEKFLRDICFITSVEARIEEMFRRKCAEEFPSFRGVVCCFSTTPKIANVYFKEQGFIEVIV